MDREATAPRKLCVSCEVGQEVGLSIKLQKGTGLLNTVEQGGRAFFTQLNKESGLANLCRSSLQVVKLGSRGRLYYPFEPHRSGLGWGGFASSPWG